MLKFVKRKIDSDDYLWMIIDAIARYMTVYSGFEVNITDIVPR